MATPRPPGVRRASVFEKRLAHAANTLPTHRPQILNGLGVRRAAARASPTLRSLQTLKILNIGFAY